MIIEEYVRNYLLNILNAPIFMDIPKKDIPDKFYVIEKTGGSMSNHIKTSTLTIQSYANSLYEASILNEQLKFAMEYKAIGLPEIASINLDGDYNFTDTTTKRFRYQAVFNIVHY